MRNYTPEQQERRGRRLEVFFNWAIFPATAIILYSFYKYFSKVYSLGFSDFLKLVLNNLKQIGLMALLAAAAVIIVGLFILLQGLFGKWRSVRVFISYQHQHTALVTKLEAILKTKWIKPDLIPFLPADHDTIIEKVQKSIKDSDLLIILPGLEKSFVDAEIMLASSLKKPIIFFKITDDQRIPDTSYKGYPVFDLQKLEEYRFRPLHRFILYVTKSSKDVLQNFPRTLVAFYNQSDSMTVVLGVIFFLYLISGPFIIIFANLEWQFSLGRIFFWLFTTVSIGYFLFKYLKVFTERLRVISITRQTILTGNMTYDLLSGCFTELEADKEILHCINDQPLFTKH